MTALISVLCIILIALVIVQIGRVTELAAKIRGEEAAQQDANDRNAWISLVFMVVFLISCVASAYYYKNDILWYGPHESASVHGGQLDSLFDITLLFTGIVFFITQILLFWFAYRYKNEPGRKALYMPHDNKLEIIWTVIPAVVMTFLVVGGLDAWNEVMADVPEDAVAGEDYIEIEATGMQFLWSMRYPGKDNLLGTKDFRKITANNSLGIDFSDPKSWDDVVSSAAGEVIKLPIGKQVRVRITARDVLHNFDLPHFRVKMDAIPGLPTYFTFTPSITTEDYRAKLGALNKDGSPKYPEWHELSDPTDPESEPRWKAFQFELACAELCGRGHYSMRRIVEVVSEEEWREWANSQTSFYFSSIRGSEEDPNLGKLLPIEIRERKEAFTTAVKRAIESTEETDKVLRLEHVNFETGSARLTANSRYELDNLVSVLDDYENMTIEVAGHTDATGDPEMNMELSDSRAQAVYNYLTGKGISGERLVAVGYGQTQPIDSNETEEGRQKNRRTEFKILTQ